MTSPVSRRRFLGATALGGAAFVGSLGTGRLGSAGEAAPHGVSETQPPIRIHKVFLAKPVPSWPRPDLDIPAEIARLDRHMADAEKRLGDVSFVGGELIRVMEDCAKMLAKPDDSHGYLVFNLTSTVGHLLARIVEAGRPTVLFSQPYSGHDWSSIAAMQKQGKKVIALATSNYGEIAETAGLLRVGPRLRTSRILCLRGDKIPEEETKAFKQKSSVDLVSVDAARLNAAFAAVDPKAAEADADEWIRHAEKVVEPTRDEIISASRLYLAMRKLLEEERAQAITINCLGLFAQKVLPAYPCLGHCRLNDVGLVGACEADLESTLTMLAFGYAFGVPGFISDPVIDTATNTVIHAHCVSPTKMDGPAGPAAPYLIRSHLEDNKGASLQVKMRIGQDITCAKLVGYNTLLASTGTIIANPDEDRGCRTKITTAVSSARKILENYSGGLHRVVCYGNRLQSLKHLGVLMGWKVVEET